MAYTIKDFHPYWKVTQMQIGLVTPCVKSTTDFVFFLGGGAVSQKSTKQIVMARSTVESCDSLDFVRSEKNLANHLTKELSGAVGLELQRDMGLSP